MNWYLIVLKKYAVFRGRAQRKEYWYFYLVNLVIVVGLLFSKKLIGFSFHGHRIGVLAEIYWLAVLLPRLGVTVRRLHDVGKSGWWYLVFSMTSIFCCVVFYWLVVLKHYVMCWFALLMILFSIVLFVFFLARDSQPGENQYGPNPKGVKK